MMEHSFLLTVGVVFLCSNANIDLTEWNTPTPTPFSWDWHRGFYSTFDNSVYLIGYDAYKLDVSSQSWSSVSSISGSLADGQWNVVLNNIFYFLRWDNPQYIQRYNPQTGSLNTNYAEIGYVDDYNKGRCLTHNKIDIVYILGENTKFRYFNISKNTVSVSSGTSISSPGTDFGACGYYNGWVYMFGGVNDDKIRKFNVGLNNEYVATNSWQLVAETMPANSLNTGEAVSIDNYFVMGLFDNTGYKDKVYLFDINTDIFISTTTTNNQRGYGALVYLPTEDKICAFLGRDGSELSNYECSNKLHGVSPTMSPISVPTISPTAPTTALPTPTVTITTIDGTWYDDHEMVDSPNVIGWTMSQQIITNGLSTYYGPFTETYGPSTTYYYISREFKCKHTSAFSISYQEMHCETGSSDHIKTIYPGNTAGNTYILENADEYIQDSTLTSAANGACSGNPSWERTSQIYNTQNVMGGTVFTIQFEIYVTEANEDYVTLYDIQIICDSLFTLKPTISPTSNPTLSPTSNPTLSPTPNPTLSPTPNPTLSPITNPTLSPITSDPTISPTLYPTFNPTEPTLSPTEQTLDPTSPTLYPTTPTFSPTIPTSNPTEPTLNPTEQTLDPTSPTLYPTTPTASPTESTRLPSLNPTTFPSMNPSQTPSKSPTLNPSVIPTKSPVVEGRIEDETSTTSDNDVNYYGTDESLQAKDTANWIYIVIGVVLSLCIVCISIIFCMIRRKTIKQHEEQWRKMALPSVSVVATDIFQNTNNMTPKQIPSPNPMSSQSDVMNTNYVIGCNKDVFVDNLTNLNLADDIILDDIIDEMNGNGAMKATAGEPGSMPMDPDADVMDDELPPPPPNKRLAADDDVMLEMTDLTPTGFDQVDEINVTQGQYDENEDEINPNINATEFIIDGSERNLVATPEGPIKVLS